MAEVSLSDAGLGAVLLQQLQSTAPEAALLHYPPLVAPSHAVGPAYKTERGGQEGEEKQITSY